MMRESAPSPANRTGLTPRFFWKAGRFVIDLQRPAIMAIVNCTPDSFYDGGKWIDPRKAVEHAERCVQEGADCLDLGAESTRPGADPVDAGTEWARLEPVIREVVRWGLPISVDTRRTEVMRRALDAGADIINDVQALRADGALALLSGHPDAGVCLMHMRGEPRDMQASTIYADPVEEVRRWLHERCDEVTAAGVAPERILLDPGIGFAKRPEHNWKLLARQSVLQGLPRPLLVGWSRKSTLGLATGRSVEDRLASSLAAALYAAQAGAVVLRVHDVAETKDVLSVMEQVEAHRQ